MNREQDSAFIPFNKPYFTGKELEYIQQAHNQWHLSGDGPFTRKCHAWLEQSIGTRKALLTHSCTAALEMAAILIGIESGDEVIMPSYTFVSTANAFVLRGGLPVFVDIRPDTLNIDESKIEAAITKKTKVIVVVHYGGIACEMDTILSIAHKHNLFVIEDAAQAIGAKYKGKPLGSIGHLSALSFHETKNIISGEGGALLINDDRFIERAEIIREKGTDRNRFLKGQVDKYTWVDIGSSYLPSDLTAAFLWAQLEEFEKIMHRRKALWDKYHESFSEAEVKGYLRRPVIPENCQSNAHLYYILLPTAKKRDSVLSLLNKKGVNVVFHYIPLHDSPAGEKYGRTSVPMQVTVEMSRRIIRLPLWIGLEKNQNRVIDEVLLEVGGRQ
ncbi:dTDP-4-amino-4,6-dideoxygalactose transaminase [Candidatus Roizmanbacteria bacterium]|nr:dTDP-4-amino-4,6-dideoxygalactose transaminase [Candidatus Roizmanbacteria bacterium]